MKRERGFTLIELMVVVIILGVLAAVALPKFIDQQKKGKENAAWADIHEMTTACELYYLDNDAYPSQLSTLESGYMDFRRGKVGGTSDDVPNDPYGIDFGFASGTNYFSVWTNAVGGTTYAASRLALYKPNVGMRICYPALPE